MAVHGDAHLEQFVVTGQSFGLGDFDMSGFGPAVVDMVRYAASLHVACREMPWACDGDAAVAAYFEAYREALNHPVERKQIACSSDSTFQGAHCIANSGHKALRRGSVLQ